MIKLTITEQRILQQIQKHGRADIRYDFWFTYVKDKCEHCDSTYWKAVGYEGGFELQLKRHFRNQYSVQSGHLTKNW